jgi:hypothetical protein
MSRVIAFHSRALVTAIRLRAIPWAVHAFPERKNFKITGVDSPEKIYLPTDFNLRNAFSVNQYIYSEQAAAQRLLFFMYIIGAN